MSYSILLEDRNKKPTLIPITTNSSFYSYWEPIFIEMQCTNLENLQYAHKIEEDEFKNILKEFIKIKPMVKEDVYLEDLNFIISEIQKIDFSLYESIYAV